ncbi:unnamed protein product [Ectocarpus sp. 8 AP-2014]
MEDALKLQGYLMKEKSKLSRLHGLTGDINKRYFKIQSIEGSEELALCYYKKFNVPEIRGWIYLKDVTEIAEDQDTIIVTSAARTLHLYAQTRAQHNLWVTGLAKLCPHAFAMLGRNASVRRMENDLRMTSPTDTSLTKPAVADRSFAKDRDKPVMDPPENHSVDGVESSPSTNESDSQSESFQTAGGHDIKRDRNGRHRGQSAGDHGAPEESHASWSTPRRDSRNVARKQRHRGDAERGRRGGNERVSKGPCHRRREEYEDSRLVRSSGRLVHRGNTCDKGSTRLRKEERQGQRSRGSGGESVAKASSHDEEESSDTSASPTRNSRNAGDTKDDRDAGATSTSYFTGLQASASDEDGHEDVADERDLEPCGQYAGRLDEGLNPTSVGEKGSTVSSDIVVVRPPESQDDEMTKKSRAYYSSDNENVETIELDEGESPVVAHNVQVRQPEDNPAPASVPRKNNQDEEKEEVDEEADIDLAVPRLEIGDWEGPHQGQSATSRLHRHISRRDTEAVGFSGGVPSPKEFLTHKLAESPSTTDCERNTGSDSLPKPTTNGRRRSAADLEWNDGGETPDRPRCTEATLTHSGNSRPVALDFEDHGGNNLNLEVEKQRRRAAAAVLALETAAKEADEGAQVESECLGDCKRDSSGGARGVVAKAYPSPAGPPPAELLRKSRRGRGAPPPGVAPPKTAPSRRAKPSNRPRDSDENSTDDDRDDETKKPRNDSPVAGASGEGRYSLAEHGASGFPRQALGYRQPNQWIHSDA